MDRCMRPESQEFLAKHAGATYAILSTSKIYLPGEKTRIYALVQEREELIHDGCNVHGQLDYNAMCQTETFAPWKRSEECNKLDSYIPERN